MGLTKSNARELAKRNVTVNAVAPGFIATAMTDALPEKTRQELAAQIPLERLGTAEDIANAVLFLAAERSGYITGQVIGVNGGMYM
jgi:3-oxoacyl-[acyl-carrier protein] reductase